MNDFFQNLLTASLQGSIIILTVLLLRRVLQKTSKKMISSQALKPIMFMASLPMTMSWRLS